MPSNAAVWAPVLWFLWAVMYILVVLTSRMIYAEATRRGQNAELWVLINVAAGITGLLLILTASLVRDVRAVWLFTITGSLLLVLGPVVYMATPKPSGGREIGAQGP